MYIIVRNAHDAAGWVSKGNGANSCTIHIYIINMCTEHNSTAQLGYDAAVRSMGVGNGVVLLHAHPPDSCVLLGALCNICTRLMLLMISLPFHAPDSK